MMRQDTTDTGVAGYRLADYNDNEDIGEEME
jgi:hypothetical protein